MLFTRRLPNFMSVEPDTQTDDFETVLFSATSEKQDMDSANFGFVPEHHNIWHARPSSARGTHLILRALQKMAFMLLNRVKLCCNQFQAEALLPDYYVNIYHFVVVIRTYLFVLQTRFVRTKGDLKEALLFSFNWRQKNWKLSIAIWSLWRISSSATKYKHWFGRPKNRLWRWKQGTS